MCSDQPIDTYQLTLNGQIGGGFIPEKEEQQKNTNGATYRACNKKGGTYRSKICVAGAEVSQQMFSVIDVTSRWF